MYVYSTNEKNYHQALSLVGKTVLVTGATGDIGRVASLQLAKAGAEVVLLARNVKLLESMYDEFLAMNLPKPSILPFNLATASADDYAYLVELINKHYFKLDALIHNASILKSFTPIEHFTLEDWFITMQVNLNAKFLLTKFLLPTLKKTPGSKIIFAMNKAAKGAKAFWGAYASAEAGVEAFANVLADELDSSNVTVMPLYLPEMQTKSRKRLFPAEPDIDTKLPEAIEVCDMFVTALES